MRKNLWWIVCVLFVISVAIISWKPADAIKNKSLKSFTAKELFAKYVADVYNTANLQQSGMDLSVFQKAFTGYLNLKLNNKLHSVNYLTVVDFNKSSRVKRMWIVDILNRSLVLNTWVAHGQGSGDDMASRFSNTNESHESSLGFYLTDDIYFGKHGRSLRLDGLEAGINSAARARGIVIHAADYVCQNTINQIGRLGRSFGCPAVSPEVSNTVINTIKGGSLLYINGNDSNYTSKLLDDTAPTNFVMQETPAVDTLSASTIAKL
ncbi:murein L,D-transpeptidase catalytic domain family protein [Mucilaginibacter achroorhodeus]|uniref:Murein L,D-transpeptidase catalytic domain family protein n=1 Tax=Mucilaginibacter achroorhodeus TaxID=2599294 RepID=A0A563U175_9SPHI|nr:MULTISPECIES: murein L,D-transpeptidase catalytic domain family protein [Mucilaginibacter]QXV67488.1 murein L,D-transpeptidase catalytic domain family protein [Mucilaginibacter sp. 21P]TWR25364.1 murein L,D-transpeptidase catalytic domain family protein [Mucilaginibacter achroorhodeus]